MNHAGTAALSLKSAQKLWKRRVRMLPVAFLLLIGFTALGVHLRAFIAGVSPQLDVSEFLGARDTALGLSRALVERSEKPVPMHDLAFLVPVRIVKPVLPAVTAPRNGRAGTSMKADPPPVPRLEGIMFSRTKPSLAVFDNQAAGKGDVVGGWRVLRIEPEQVFIVNDESGVEKVVILYENEKKQ